MAEFFSEPDSIPPANVKMPALIISVYGWPRQGACVRAFPVSRAFARSDRFRAADWSASSGRPRAIKVPASAAADQGLNRP